MLLNSQVLGRNTSRKKHTFLFYNAQHLNNIYDYMLMQVQTHLSILE